MSKRITKKDAPKSFATRKLAKKLGIKATNLKVSRLDPSEISGFPTFKPMPELKVTWASWISYMEKTYGTSEGWGKLRNSMTLPLGGTELVYRGQRPMDLETMVKLYDSNDTNPVGKAYWQETLLTFIAEGV